MAEIKNQVDEILENIRGINSKVENVISLVDDISKYKTLFFAELIFGYLIKQSNF